MPFPIPLIFGTGKSGSSKVETDEGVLTIKRNLSQINSIRTEGEVSLQLEGEERYKLEARHKGGDRYQGTWQTANGTQALPEAVACEAYEAVRHLAGKKLDQADVVDDLVELVTQPMDVTVRQETCKGR